MKTSEPRQHSIRGDDNWMISSNLGVTKTCSFHLQSLKPTTRRRWTEKCNARLHTSKAFSCVVLKRWQMTLMNMTKKVTPLKLLLDLANFRNRKTFALNSPLTCLERSKLMKMKHLFSQEGP